MNLANWTTHFRAGDARNHERQPDGHRPPSGGADPQGASAQPPGSHSLVGHRVGAYLITKRLGEGGVGEVFKGVDEMLGREVAIKVLHDEFASDPLFVERFSREAKLHAKLSHPNVATVHAFLHEGDKQFLVMEFVAGISLEEFVRSGGPVPVRRALDIFRRALDGIEHAHRNGIVHRDIKPANIMVAGNGAVKVMDFGIARALDSQDHLTRHGQVAGTAKAMSPEQIRGAEADVRSDVYSLGIVLYTLLAGRPPFEADNDLAMMKAQLEQAPPPLRALVPDLPPEVEAAVMRALRKDPSARFQTVGDFSRALAASRTDATATMAASPASASASRDAPTMSRTAVNPVLGHGPAQPKGAAASPMASDAAAAATVVRPVPAKPMHRKLPRLAAVALALSAVAAGGIFLVPRMMQRAASPAMPPKSVPVPAASPLERLSVAPEPVAPAAEQPPAQPPALAAAVVPRTLSIVPLGSDGRFKPGERVRLQVVASQDAHVYCYLQDETRRVMRFYPNRFRQSALVTAAAPLEIPGAMRFEIVANKRNVTETIACFASPRDPIDQLPSKVVGKDFAKLPVASLDEVRSAFARVGADKPAEASFVVRFR